MPRGNMPRPLQPERFSKLLSNVAASFVNLPTERVDQEIENALLLSCECLGRSLPRCSVGRISGPHM
jgi:hypothetical protein